MIAKLIAFGSTRRAAAEKLAEACRMTEIWPVKTNAVFLSRCLEEPDFLKGSVDTGFIESRIAGLAAEHPPSQEVLQAAARAMLPESRVGMPIDPVWTQLSGFRLNADPAFTVRLQHAETVYAIQVHPQEMEAKRSLCRVDEQIIVFEYGQAFAFTQPRSEHAAEAIGSGAILSSMPGRIVAVQAVQGEAVVKGQALLTLEAMKMEHTLRAPFDGIIEDVSILVGDQVSEGVLLVRLTANLTN